MDIDDGQIQKAKENINFAEVGNRIHAMKASSMSKKNGPTYFDGYHYYNKSKGVKQCYVLVKTILSIVCCVTSDLSVSVLCMQ